MKVIAIVVTYNRSALLSRVLDSLLAQKYKLHKILIIDNDSKDNTCSVIDSYMKNCEGIIYYNTGDNLGGAGGFHEGFKLSEKFDYDYLWLMDDDFLPTPDCLYELIKDNYNGISQPLRYNVDESCAEISPVEYDLKKIFCKNPKLNTVADLLESGKMTGLNYINIAGVPFEGPLISRDVVSEVGYPNPDFFIFNDDLDYSLRTRRKGFAIRCVFSAKAYRLIKNDQGSDLDSWKGYFMLRNHFYILRNYGENFFVVNRSILICLYYIFKSIVKMDLKFIKVVTSSFFDSFTLRNSKLHRP
ncbi:glycosyltransferase [Edwardsiella tarda]|uniref:glycosyltransferase n=1 Tax=Edwardsiella tarda TaxID=636 RepID=UPI0034DD27A9